MSSPFGFGPFSVAIKHGKSTHRQSAARKPAVEKKYTEKTFFAGTVSTRKKYTLETDQLLNRGPE